jgi:hypothetical protein
MIFCYLKAASYALLALSTQTCLIVAKLDRHKASIQKFLYEMLKITSSV